MLGIDEEEILARELMQRMRCEAEVLDFLNMFVRHKIFRDLHRVAAQHIHAGAQRADVVQRLQRVHR